MNSARSKNNSKYQRFTLSGSKDKGHGKFELVAMTYFIYVTLLIQHCDLVAPLKTFEDFNNKKFTYLCMYWCMYLCIGLCTYVFMHVLTVMILSLFSLGILEYPRKFHKKIRNSIFQCTQQIIENDYQIP